MVNKQTQHHVLTSMHSSNQTWSLYSSHGGSWRADSAFFLPLSAFCSCSWPLGSILFPGFVCLSCHSNSVLPSGQRLRLLANAFCHLLAFIWEWTHVRVYCFGFWCYWLVFCFISTHTDFLLNWKIAPPQKEGLLLPSFSSPCPCWELEEQMFVFAWSTHCFK